MIVRFLLALVLIHRCYAEEYHFAGISGAYGHMVGEIMMTHIYTELGYDLKITRFPPKRAEIEAKHGRVDGEIMRVWSYGIDNPELIRIPTSYYYLETMAFYKKGSGINIHSSEELSDYFVLRVRGVKHTNTITEGLLNVYDYDNSESMFRALNKDRKSIAVAHRGDGLFTIEKYKIKDIESTTYPLSSFPLYHYVHKKNAHLVEKINRLILKMKNSGKLLELIERAEKQVFEQQNLILKTWY